MKKTFIALSFVMAASANAALKTTVTSATQKALNGDVTMEKEKDGLHLKVRVTGLTPNSTHGFHVHETGECKGPDYKSAGGHFNPDHTQHGAADSKMSHLGDLGNLVSDKNGVATIDRVIPNKDLAHVNEMVGKAVIIHAKADDLKSQPAGDSGDRIGCGVIKEI